MGGKTDVVKGRIKEAVGALTNNNKFRAEGKTDQAVGKVKQAAQTGVAKAKDAAQKDCPCSQGNRQTGGGEFEVIVEGSDKIRLDGSQTGHGFVVTTKILTSSDINYVHCAGELAGTFAIRREADFVTKDDVLTFADVTLKDGKKLPVSLRLAPSRIAAPVRVGDADNNAAEDKVREATARTQSVNNLNQIGLAIHHEKLRLFPARANFDPNGKPLLSWRPTSSNRNSTINSSSTSRGMAPTTSS